MATTVEELDALLGGAEAGSLPPAPRTTTVAELDELFGVKPAPSLVQRVLTGVSEVVAGVGTAARLAGLAAPPGIPPVPSQTEVLRREPGAAPGLFPEAPIAEAPPVPMAVGRLKEVPEPVLPGAPTPEVSDVVRAAVTTGV